MAEERQRAGCFKIGCFGCLLPVTVVVALLLLMTVAQLRRDSSDREVVERELLRELPAAPDLESLLRSGEVGGRPLPLEDPGLFERTEIAPSIGTVVLDLSLGEFTIRAGEPGEPIRVNADFESDAFALRERFEEGEDGRWTYRVSFGARGGILGMMFRGAGNNPRNDIEIILPRGQPFDLVGKLGLGETEIDLGGLWIRRLDLEAGTGEHQIEISEPMLAPMSYFAIDKGVGELSIDGLGNASPREVVLKQSIGELSVDLGGRWSVDSRLAIDFGVGECRISVPEGVRVEVERLSTGLGDRRVRRFSNEGVPEDAPTLTLDVRAKIGEVTIQ